MGSGHDGCVDEVAYRNRSRFIERVMLGLATVAAATVGLAAPASATTETFNYTGAAQTWTVPAGVTSASFDLYGAQGGDFVGASSTGLGGRGGRASATISVSPGDSIQVNVGGRGVQCCSAPFPAGGFNGGGMGDLASGGGASDIRVGGTTLASRVLVAGGGGGSGQAFTTGGAGGGLTGGDGDADGDSSKVAGGGGTQVAGGTAGNTPPTTPGSLGAGGNGGAVGGGGGGGYYGGGGGFLAAGGGGSGYGPTGTVFQTAVRSGNGLVTVTYTEPVTIADLIDSVNALNVDKGTKNSLLKKLNGAGKNLSSGNTGGACDKLASFISQVKALRSKKIIPASAADQLIADARAVRASIGCS